VFRVEEERIYFAGRVAARLDETGSPNFGRMDRLGSVKAWQRYPFGEGNESNWNDEYATYPIDRWTGHYYAWNRFYSATWGRFSSPDPYVMSGGLTHPQGWNRYSYVANDPVNFYDPEGLFAVRPGFGSGPTLGGPSSGSQSGGDVWSLPGASDQMGMEVDRFWDDSDMELPPPEGGNSGATRAGLIQNKQEAKAALHAALAWLSEECFRKLGITRSAAMKKAKDILFFDGRATEDGSSNILQLLGPSISVKAGATFRTVSAYQRAVVLPLEDGRLSKYVVLGASFFNGGQSWVDQYVTLAHESFHYTLQKWDVELARYAGYQGRDRSTASSLFSKWLKEGCK
jgi:RHS repeat-associated protein